MDTEVSIAPSAAGAFDSAMEEIMIQLFPGMQASRPTNVRMAAGRQAAALGMVATLVLASVPGSAAEHVISREQLHQAVAETQTNSRANRSEIMQAFGSSQAKAALSSAGIEYQQVEQAVATLDEESASKLAERARAFNKDFAAGAFNNQMLTYIVIALATAIIVLIAV